jgi:hypothetical protein
VLGDPPPGNGLLGGAFLLTQTSSLNEGFMIESAPIWRNTVPEPLPEHQKTQLIVRSPLSTEGFVSIYFSSPEGRLMSEEEWWNLKQLIELTNRVCVKQQVRAQSA